MIKIILKRKILTEEDRETDRVYGGLALLIYNLLLDNKAYHMMIREFTKESIWSPILSIKFKPSLNFTELYSRFFKKYNNTQIVRNLLDFKKFLLGLEIHIVPSILADKKVGGTMSDDGLLTIVDLGWDNGDILDDDEREERSPGNMYYEKINMSLEEVRSLYGINNFNNIKKIIENFKNRKYDKEIKRVLSHEIGHYISAFRTSEDRTSHGRVSNRSNISFKTIDKEIKKQKKDTGQTIITDLPSYANDQEEFQARYTQVFFLLEKVLSYKFPQAVKDYQTFLNTTLNEKRILQSKYSNLILKKYSISINLINLILSLIDNEFNSFKELMEDFSDYNVYKEKLTQASKFKFLKRVTTTFETYKKLKNDPRYTIFPAFKIYYNILDTEII